MENNEPVLKCYCCHSVYNESDKFCGKCGYPLQASRQEQSRFIMNFTTQKDEIKNAKARVREARIILYVIAAFTFIASIRLLFNNANITEFALNLVLASLFVYLGFLAEKKAFAAILIAGLIYIALTLLYGFMNPSTLTKGIIIKGLVIAALIRGAYGAYKYKV